MKITGIYLDSLIKRLNKKNWFLDSWWGGVWLGLGAWMYVVTPNRLVGSFLFSFGLFFIILHQAELFTGNFLWCLLDFQPKIGIKLGLIYLGNFLGAFSLAFISKPNPELFSPIITVKMSTPWLILFFKGILCNWLVCSAVYQAAQHDKVIEKFLLISSHIIVFVYLGFEHSIANFFFLAASKTAIYPFLRNNLLPVTLGNIVGGIGVVINLKYRAKG